MKAILKHLNMLNLIIVAVIALFAVLAIVLLSDTSVEVGPAAGGAKLPQVPGADRAASVPPFAGFAVITEKNVFHPDRKSVETEANAEGGVVADVEFVLYGTLITSDLRVAYIEDKKNPLSSPGRGTRHRALRVDDTLSGYTVASIGHESVLMKRGGTSVVVEILDPDKKRSQARVAAPKGQSRKAPVKTLPKTSELIKRLKMKRPDGR